MEITLLLLFGILGGVLGGMGMGGGTLLIPLLTIFLNVKQQNAQSINLIAFLPMSLVALCIHFKNRLVKVKVAIPIIISGVISSIFASFLANVVDSKRLAFWFGIFLIAVGIFQIFSIWIFKNKKSQNISSNKI